MASKPIPVIPLTPAQRDWVQANMAIVWSVAGQNRHRRLLARLGRDDVFQYAFVVMCRAVQTFRPERGASLATHVRNCVEWKVIALYAETPGSFIRQLVDQNGETDQAVAVYGEARPDGDADVMIDYVEKVRPLLDKLPPRHRQVIELHYGLRRREAASVAKEMGVTRSRVSYIHKLAIAALRRRTKDMAIT